jgi:hypothetical protein
MIGAISLALNIRMIVYPFMITVCLYSALLRLLVIIVISNLQMQTILSN